MSETQPPEQYEITVEGILASRWSAWFQVRFGVLAEGAVEPGQEAATASRS